MKTPVRRRSAWLALILLAAATPGTRRLAVAGSSGPAETADAGQAARDDVVRFVRNFVDARNNGETGPLLDLYSAKPGVSTADMGVITHGREGIRAAADRQSGSQGAERLTLGGIEVASPGLSIRHRTSGVSGTRRSGRTMRRRSVSCATW